MKRRARALAASIAPARRLALLAVLLAFVFQAFAVQTHLHGQPAAATLAQHVFAVGPAKPLPADPLDSTTCKLCQELVHAGAAMTPYGPDALLLLNWMAAFFPPAQVPAAAIAPETGWQSRAPPQH